MQPPLGVLCIQRGSIARVNKHARLNKTASKPPPDAMLPMNGSARAAELLELRSKHSVGIKCNSDKIILLSSMS